MSVAFFNTAGAAVHLSNFSDTVVLRVQVPQGKYVVFGKISITNADSDDQNASAQLTSKDGSKIIRNMTVRLDGNSESNSQSVSVQGVLNVEAGGDIVDIRCATFNGNAAQAT